jgi:hypothetical protein
MQHRIRIHKVEPNVGHWDFSHLLDAPAGKHGFVTARNGHLYFADGTRAKFIGFNIAARSNMPDHETAEKMAHRFATMGVNVIRLHAADNIISDTPLSWSCSREAPLIDYESGSSRNFHPEGLDRFDYLVAKLKEKGIYLHVDLLVARSFLPGDGLDYPGTVPSTAKCYPTMNERLIQLQQEYARKLLCHVNPYTRLALVDDPAVITIQISNEESFIRGTEDTDYIPEMQPYRDERQARFNAFLRMKYHTRQRLKEAWTFEGICALDDDEDPEENTVRVVPGSFHQPTNDPMGQWNGTISPARYADYMEFGIYMNRKYYQRMKDFLISLGVKVPIVCSNLLGGAADVYGHIDGDIMENDSYFNHPIPPFKDRIYSCVGPAEYVSVNPLTMQTGIGSMATTLHSFGSVAIVKGKPFILSEWNEYGLHPFHSTSLVQTVAYACLNDWDGLIVYNHHTSDNWDDQPADEIHSVFDAYNDPAMICQWGFMATVFLKGLVSRAKSTYDVVYTQNDLRTLPPFHSMPTTIFPYIGSMRNVFLDGGDQYQGDADVAINAGFVDCGDLSCAKHGIYYSWSPYRDAWRCSLNPVRLKNAAKDGMEIMPGVSLGRQALVIDNIREVFDYGDYRRLASVFDRALKEWGVIDGNTGYVDGKLISDTGELILDPQNARFHIHTPYCAFFSGAPEDITLLSDNISAKIKNDRISVSLLPADSKELNKAKEYLLTAMGRTGTDGTTITPGPEYMGIKSTVVNMSGKLYAETMEGELLVKADCATLEVLNPVGEVITAIEGQRCEEGVRIILDGTIPGVQYRLIIQ